MRHISTGHPETADYYYEILETIENPERIYQGNRDELIAVSAKQGSINKFLVVVYKEIDFTDGFVITAYISSKEEQFEKRRILCKQ